jgi:hypothetical protein
MPTACAALILRDGSIRVATQERLVEYGGTLDACCRTLNSPASQPTILMQLDQFGVLHSPHAQARAYFHEYGYDDVVVAVHTPGGSVELPTIASLAPCESTASKHGAIV